ncbi:hypothetical protein D3C80_1562760 [compost metagenome]
MPLLHPVNSTVLFMTHQLHYRCYQMFGLIAHGTLTNQHNFGLINNAFFRQIVQQQCFSSFHAVHTAIVKTWNQCFTRPRNVVDGHIVIMGRIEKITGDSWKLRDAANASVPV